MNGTFCPRCGSVNPPNAVFCSNCGSQFAAPVAPPNPQTTPNYYPPPPPPPSYPIAPPAKSNRAVIAMVCAVLGFVACGPISSVPGIFLAKAEMDAIREGRAPRSGENLAKWAFYLSIAATAISILGICFYWSRFSNPYGTF
jgi:hypothetical protein